MPPPITKCNMRLLSFAFLILIPLLTSASNLHLPIVQELQCLLLRARIRLAILSSIGRDFPRQDPDNLENLKLILVGLFKRDSETLEFSHLKSLFIQTSQYTCYSVEKVDETLKGLKENLKRALPVDLIDWDFPKSPPLEILFKDLTKP